MTGAVAIVNPRAASGMAAERWPALVEKLHIREARFTERPGHASEIAAELLASGCTTILAVGGDGTISEAVNGFFRDGAPIRPDARLGIIPMGTGGDLQRSLGIRDAAHAVEVILAGDTRPIDVGRITFNRHEGGPVSRYFINLTSFGMGGEVAAGAKNFLSPYSGKAAFLWATVDVFFGYRPKTVELSVDGESAGRWRILNVAIGNGRYHGGGMHVCPRAKIDDGLLDVTVIEALGMLTLARNLKVLYSDNLYVHPKTHFFRGKRVRATSQERVAIEVDGEPLGVLPLEAEVLPAALRVICP